MNQPLTKKEIAAQAGISPRTMRNHREKWSWLEQCRAGSTSRPTYNRERVNRELLRRRLI